MRQTIGGNGFIRHQKEGKEVSWGMFMEDIWSCFGPTDCEDFDESLYKIQQMGSLRDYQK